MDQKKGRIKIRNNYLWIMTSVLFIAEGVSSSALASSDLDRQFRLESVGILKPIDNTDGLFVDYVEEIFKDYLRRQSRLTLANVRVADPIFSQSKFPYEKAIFDPEILKQLAQSTHSESLIRTQVQKVANRYLFQLEWLHAPRMEVISQVRFSLIEPPSGGFFEKQFLSENLENQLFKLIHELPFVGHVSGRDRASVLVNIGVDEGLQKGDILEIGTLNEVRRHPLLNQVLEWKLNQTGKVIVEKIEDGITFCRILQEDRRAAISKYQKVTFIQRSQVQAVQASTGLEQSFGALMQRSEAETPPRLGWLGLTLPIGAYSRQFSSSQGAVANQGGGFLLGAQADTEVWLTKSWFLSGKVSYEFWNFSQTNGQGNQTPATANGGVSGSDVSYLLGVGYAVPLTADFYGPRVWLKLGYRSAQTQLPTSLVENTDGFSLSSIFLGLGGTVPISQQWGAMGDLRLRLLGSASNSQGQATNSSDFEIFLGGYYQMSLRIKLRAGLGYLSASANFSDGSSLRQNMMTLGPSLLYYF